MVGRQHAFALVRDWLPAAPPAARDVALAELARRYLAGHGPATESDLARWARPCRCAARAGLGAIPAASAAARRRTARPGRAGRAARLLEAPRLLGAFEPLLLGWRSRADVLGDHEPRVVSGGVFRSFALVEGGPSRCGAACRAITRVGKPSRSPTRDASPATALERDGEALRRFLGLAR